MKNKILMSIGSLTAIATPIVAVVSCSNSSWDSPEKRTTDLTEASSEVWTDLFGISSDHTIPKVGSIYKVLISGKEFTYTWSKSDSNSTEAKQYLGKGEKSKIIDYLARRFAAVNSAINITAVKSAFAINNKVIGEIKGIPSIEYKVKQFDNKHIIKSNITYKTLRKFMDVFVSNDFQLATEITIKIDSTIYSKVFTRSEYKVLKSIIDRDSNPQRHAAAIKKLIEIVIPPVHDRDIALSLAKISIENSVYAKEAEYFDGIIKDVDLVEWRFDKQGTAYDDPKGNNDGNSILNLLNNYLGNDFLFTSGSTTTLDPNKTQISLIINNLFIQHTFTLPEVKQFQVLQIASNSIFKKANMLVATLFNKPTPTEDDWHLRYKFQKAIINALKNSDVFFGDDVIINNPPITLGTSLKEYNKLFFSKGRSLPQIGQIIRMLIPNSKTMVSYTWTSADVAEQLSQDYLKNKSGVGLEDILKYLATKLANVNVLSPTGPTYIAIIDIFNKLDDHKFDIK